MTVSPAVPLDSPAPSPLTVADLRTKIGRMQGRPAVQPVRTHPALEGLVQLQTGGTYAVTGSTSVAALLMAGPSSQGAWCAVVGTGDLGAEALAMAGVALDRVVVVPDPGEVWLEVLAALIDVLSLVVVKPVTPVSVKDAARVAARLRTRGAILVSLGEWPRCDVRLGLTDICWQGAGGIHDGGHGHLRAREATIEARRGTAPPQRQRVWLPDAHLAMRPVVEEAASAALETTNLRSVG